MPAAEPKTLCKSPFRTRVHDRAIGINSTTNHGTRGVPKREHQRLRDVRPTPIWCGFPAFRSEQTASASALALKTPCLLAEPPSTRSTTRYCLLPSSIFVVSITLNLEFMMRSLYVQAQSAASKRSSCSRSQALNRSTGSGPSRCQSSSVPTRPSGDLQYSQ